MLLSSWVLTGSCSRCFGSDRHSDVQQLKGRAACVHRALNPLVAAKNASEAKDLLANGDADMASNKSTSVRLVRSAQDALGASIKGRHHTRFDVGVVTVAAEGGGTHSRFGDDDADSDSSFVFE